MCDIQIYGLSRPGKQKVNEDFMKYSKPNGGKAVVVLADGMGGLSYGDLAAQVAAGAVFDVLADGSGRYSPEDLLRKAMIEADEKIYSLCREMKCRMGAAVTAVLIIGHTVYYTWQGNVRLYLANQSGRLRALTEDHIYHSDACCGTFLTRCINGKGLRDSAPVGIQIINGPATLYLCTDGFYQSLPENDITGFDLDSINDMPAPEDDCSLIEIKMSERIAAHI